MPTYNFLNTETGEEFQMFLKMDELDQYKLDNPNIQQMPSSPALVSGTGMAVSRTDEGWKDTLRSIKKASGRNNTINV